MAGIYLHIPFCKQACYYCDFHFSTNQEKRNPIIKAIAHEITLQRHYLGNETIKTIYFGGGTPSLLSAEELALLMEALHQNFTVLPDAEITLEANPDDLTAVRLTQLRQAGINRLSIGIQSFDDTVLTFLHRAHNTAAAVDCVAQARAAGFNNISIDLIYAIPGQPLPDWKKNIEKAIALNPEHISAYSLTIEPNTVFGRWASKGKLTSTSDDLAAVEMETLISRLAAAGYEQYEVSNFSKPGFHSRHNSSYWDQEKYLGVGPSAHSFNGNSRQYNISNNAQYLKALNADTIPFEHEMLTRADRINEYMLTTLRTRTGCNLTTLQQQTEFNLLEAHQNYIENLISNNLATLNNNMLRLTPAGLLLADKIASDLFETD